MIRPAEHQDLETLIILGYSMHQESSYRGMDFDFEKVALLLDRAIDDDDYLFLVSEHNGEVIGGFVGIITKQWFGNDLTATDMALFIHPDHRGSTTALRLIRHYIAWAKEQGCRPEAIRIGITTGVDEDKTTLLYQHCGFRHAGNLMALEDS